MARLDLFWAVRLGSGGWEQKLLTGHALVTGEEGNAGDAVGNLLLLNVPMVLGLWEDVQEMRLGTEYSSASSVVILKPPGGGAMLSRGGRLR